MIACKITNIKGFMNQLLRTEMFDHFLLSEATIVQDATFTIDGHINMNYYTNEELEENGLKGMKILPFSNLRTTCFQLIKGSKTPEYFKFVFLLSPENTMNTLARSSSGLSTDMISGIILNITYQNSQLMLTTGISYNTFVPSHILDQEWDEFAKKFLNKYSIDYEIL